MMKESQSIEVEVVEIDGVAQMAKTEFKDEIPPRQSWQDWQQWQGRIRRLDTRWWPLWALLGVIILLFLLTFGVVFAVIFMIFRMVTGFLRMLLR